MTEDYLENFSARLIVLRKAKGVSAREMSLDIGQGASYINQIEKKHKLPSLNGFFYICEYLNVSPKDFFDEDIAIPKEFSDAIEGLKKLEEDEFAHIKGIVDALNKNRK